jgi:SAM-dependent methyltransferase
MQEFVKKYVNVNTTLKILDVGSFDDSMSYRQLFKNPNWTYMGADLIGLPINNVDIVLKEPYKWTNILDESFDVVISGQTLEHVEDMSAWILEVKRVVKKGGLVCIITVWQWNEHRFPVDCWRILPDGMGFLLKTVAELKILEVYKKDFDCVGIAQK